MTAAGLKKCIPSTRSALETETASSRIGSVDVLVARMVLAEQAASSSEKSCFFVPRSSTTDSSTNSQYSSSARSVTPLIRARIASESAAVILSFSTWRPSDLPTLARQVSADSCDRLRITTSKPALAATSAIPAPMIPEPTIPTRFTVTIYLRFVRSYVACRSSNGAEMHGRNSGGGVAGFRGPDRDIPGLDQRREAAG